MKNFILFFSFTVFLSSIYARSYNACTGANVRRTELDNFCPRLEGQHPADCCPPLFKGTEKSCEYYVVKKEGQPYYVTGSATVCSNGENVQVECCFVAKQDCYEDLLEIKFSQRLIYREKSCCVEDCPDVTYWQVPPPSPGAKYYSQIQKLTANHVRSLGHQQCTPGIAGTCRSGALCSAVESPCPVPIPEPTPSPTPTPNPNPNPTPTPTPSPGPSPNPEPGPSPAPSAPPEPPATPFPFD